MRNDRPLDRWRRVVNDGTSFHSFLLKAVTLVEISSVLHFGQPNRLNEINAFCSLRPRARSGGAHAISFCTLIYNHELAHCNGWTQDQT